MCSSFYNPGNPQPLHRQRWIQTPYLKPLSTRDDSVKLHHCDSSSKSVAVQEKSMTEPRKKRPTQKFYINPFRFASLFRQSKLSEMKNFKGPDVIDIQKQPINIEVDLSTVSLRYDMLRKADNHISRFIKCFHHAAAMINREQVMLRS